MPRKSNSGFTLLEVSIVLLIIGALISGVVLGKSLMVTSRLQTVITDANNYTLAIGNFKQAYQALPGDMATATSMWGSGTVTSNCNNLTCNGNADGEIGYGSGSANVAESFAFWQQLNLAGMASQHFTGTAGPLNAQNAIIGTNVPAGSMEGSGFSILWGGGGNALADTTNLSAGYWGNILAFGSVYSNMLTTAPVLSPANALSIDGKIDDGVPSTGKVRSPVYGSNYAPNCATNATPSAYNITSTTSGSILCSLFFLTGY